MERGAKQFFEGLMQEMAPALDELTQLIEDAGPACRISWPRWDQS